MVIITTIITISYNGYNNNFHHHYTITIAIQYSHTYIYKAIYTHLNISIIRSSRLLPIFTERVEEHTTTNNTNTTTSHFCLNINPIISSPCYFNELPHLKEKIKRLTCSNYI